MSQKLTRDTFSLKANKIHNNQYDYSFVNYKDCYTKITIICPLHGEFYQSPTNHLIGNGCPKCGEEKRRKNRNLGTDKFIKRAILVHGTKYSYLHSTYTGIRSKVKIECPIHGEFFQVAGVHLSGKGCPKCKSIAIGNSCRKDIKAYIKEASFVHNNKYDYSEVVYINMRTKIIIKCPKHGMFHQRAESHLKGQGCPLCYHRASKWEKKLFSFTKQLYPDAVASYRGWYPGKPHREIDIFIPSLSIGFECNGVYWHKIFKDNDCSDKVLEASKLGILLYVLWDNVSVEKNKIDILLYLDKRNEQQKIGKEAYGK